MENLIERILDLEKEAQKVMDDADFEKQNIQEDIIKEIKNLEAELNARMEKKINEIKAMEEEVAKSRIAEIEKGTQESLVRLKSLYQQHGDEWGNMLFERLFKS